MRKIIITTALSLSLFMSAAPNAAHAGDNYAMALEGFLSTSFKQSQQARSFGKTLVAFYQTRQFELIWVDDNGLNEKAKRLLVYLSKAASEGLNPKDYRPASLFGFSSDISHLNGKQQALMRLEVRMTVKALKYASDLMRGRVNPTALSEHLTPSRPVLDIEQTMQALVDVENPGEYLATLSPKHKGYKRLRTALAKALIAVKTTSWTKIPNYKGKIKPRRSSKMIALVRKRLTESGDYKRHVSDLPSDKMLESGKSALKKSRYYDAGLVKAVKQFQKRHGLGADGVIGRNTIKQFNMPLSGHIKTILANMERYRWLPRELGKRHVFVNQADYRMRVIDDGKIIHSARVIIGKRKHETPIFSNHIETVVLNPYWNIPESIVTEEILPRLGSSTSALESRGYEVVDRGYNQSKQRRRSSSFSFFGFRMDDSSEEDFGEKGTLRLRQPPGPGNALGRVKFLFPNQHAVYMHDTPMKSLFRHSRRAFSHGCVRVQDARKFANIILGLDAGWSAKKIRRAIASGKNRPIKLKTKIPVHLTYFTAWIDDQGALHTRPDIYGRDRQLNRAMGNIKLAMK